MQQNIFITILLLASSVLIAQQKEPTLSFDKEIHDFGKIKEDGGKVDYKFMFANTGAQPLVLTNIKPSCGCTSTDYTKKPVMPGERGFLNASFDPRRRPGNFNKSITVESNAQNSPLVLRIKGEVLPKEKSIEDLYPFKIGGLRLESNHFGLAKINIDEVKKESFPVVNISDMPIEISFRDVPKHLKLEPAPKTLAPGEKGVIKAEYNAKMKDDWDFVYDRVYLLQNGKMEANNRITVSATIVENFSHLSEEELANAPVVKFEEKKYDFGKAKQREKITHDFKFTNAGKSDLVIRKIRSSCGCTTVAPKDNVIAPGGSSSIKAIFNTGSRKGSQSKTITVITNDPRNSKTMLWLKGEVVK